MPVIALLGNKGGAGKTTLCVNLAAALATKSPTIILDADPQQSSFQWHQMADEYDGLEVIDASDQPADSLQLNNKIYTYFLIDCPPSVHSEQMQQALRVADLAIIPIQPSPLDLWATVHVEKEVTLARKENPELKARLLINQFESRTQLSQIMRRALEELTIPAAESQIKRRVAYRNSLLEGRTVHDIGYKGKSASKEIFELVREMEKLL